jgi:hypothetical protein
MRPWSTTQTVLGLALAALCGLASGDAHAPRALLVQVRDTPPAPAPGFRHGPDNSYTVSTGGSGERDERTGKAESENGTTVSTSMRMHVVHLVEGERVRVDLPSVQSLQFHAPVPNAAGMVAPSAGSPAKSSPPARGVSPNGTGPGAAGVVYFEAVSAFTARFAVVGARVRIELVPLRAGSVAAPYVAGDGGAAGTRSGPMIIDGRLGEWIALGDTELPDSGNSLTPTAEPVTPARVWVRVQLDGGGDQP